MPVVYNNSELRPAPLVDIKKNFIRSGNGKIVHAEYVLTLTGTIVSTGDIYNSPGDQGIAVGMQGILAEQQRLRSIMSDGGRLEITSPENGSFIIDLYCVVEDINFSRGTWFNRCEYSIVLRSRAIAEDNEYDSYLDNFNENWSINQNEDGTYTISHELEAKGGYVFGPSGQINTLPYAKQWVQDRMVTITTTGLKTPNNPTVAFNLSNVISSLSSTTQNYWNKSVIEAINASSNSYRIVENLIYNPNGNYREVWNASVAFESNNPRRINVTISGEVVGFSESISDAQLKITNAQNAFRDNVYPNLFTRIQFFLPSTEYVLSPVPTTRQVTYERQQGILRYTHTYAASTGNLIPNSIEENITVADIGSTDVFAQIPIPGRANGPIVQQMNTITLPERTVTITATISPDTNPISLASLASFYAEKPNTDSIIQQLAPNNSSYMVKSNSEEWNPLRKQYSRSVSWQLLRVNALGTPNRISNF